jgi:four helix bundle protein
LAESGGIERSINTGCNIAEGNSRRSEKDKYRFMEYALGSAFELETQTLVLQRRKWAPIKEAEQILQAVEEQQRCSKDSCPS